MKFAHLNFISYISGCTDRDFSTNTLNFLGKGILNSEVIGAVIKFTIEKSWTCFSVSGKAFVSCPTIFKTQNDEIHSTNLKFRKIWSWKYY